MTSEELPLISTSYKDDQKILDFCNKNRNDKRCQCVIPPSSIQNLQLNSFNPYYCWFEGCNNPENFQTSLLSEYKKKCNIVLCEVKTDDIVLEDNGSITINNNCISQTNLQQTTNIISQELLDESLNENYILPDIFPKT